MSVVAAIEYPGGVYVGCDSFIGDSIAKDSLRCPKFFRRGALLVGCTGSWRVMQLAKGAEIPVCADDGSYLSDTVLTALRLAINSDRGVRNAEWEMLIAYRGHAYEVLRDWSIYESEYPVMAIGAGAPSARAALDALVGEGMDYRKAMRKALAITARRCPMVEGRFWYEDVRDVQG